MKKIFLDILKILKFKKKEKLYKRIFFCENKFIFNYIKQYIDKKKSCLVSYEKLDLDDDNYYYFENNFFLEFFFYILKIKYFYTSTPNIGENICRKSILKRTKYIYLQHSSVGLINAYDKNAFINFDAVNVINKYQIYDVLNINKYFKKKIKLFKSKPNYLKNIYIQTDEKYDLLIAPTWNTNFYEDHFLFNLIEVLNENKIYYRFRPHPMSIKKYEFDLKFYKEKKINFDNSTNLNLFSFENLITDWSGIMFEFFYLKQKKPLLIDTYEKKINKLNIINNYKSMENLLRGEIGIIHTKNEFHSIIKTLKDPINNKIDITNYEIFF
tara:strand:+ start:4192 stop:5169 length:978 start_codon:yes stop_codon:yes gene_type:complete